MLAHTLTQTEKFNFESSIYIHIIQIQDTGILMPSIQCACVEDSVYS